MHLSAGEYVNPYLMSALLHRVLASGRAVQGAGWHAGPKLTSVSGPNKGFAKDAAFYPGQSEVSVCGTTASLGCVALQLLGLKLLVTQSWKGSMGCRRGIRADGSGRTNAVSSAVNRTCPKKFFCSVASRDTLKVTQHKP